MSMMNPRYMLLEAGATSPQWFDDGAKLMERVRAITSCAAAPKTSHRGMPPSLWVDIESRGATDEVRRVLSELPLCDESAIPASVRTTLVDCGDIDAVELQPITGSYVRGTLKCLTQHRSVPSAPAELFVCAGADEQSELHGGHSDAMHKHDSSSAHGDTSLQPEAIGSTEMEETMCSFLVTRRVAVTVHTTSFLGLKELLWTMTHTAVSAAAATAQEAATQSNNSCTFMWFTSVVLSHLICYSTETMMPDPSVVLPEINIGAEMALFLPPSEEDQPDLLYRISMVRRRIADMRMQVYLRESILRRFLTSAYRASFLCQNESCTLQLYRDTADKLHKVNEQFNDMHKALNQINLNFITSSSMRIVQLSAGMTFMMMIFSEVAVMCLPLHVFVSLLGMNVLIPYDKSTTTSLNAFWFVLALMLTYIGLLAAKITRTYLTMEKNDSLVPNL